MIVKIQNEEKTLQRHLAMNFRALFQRHFNLEGLCCNYNLYLNDILYIIQEGWEISPIVRPNVCIKFIPKDQDPLTQELLNIRMPELNIRPERYYHNRQSFLSKSHQVVQQQQQQQQQIKIYQSQPLGDTVLNPIAGTNEKNVLIRIPVIQELMLNLVIIFQVLKDAKKEEILIQYGDSNYQVSEDDKTLQITMKAFQEGDYGLDKLAEFYSCRDITIFWDRFEYILAIQWPNNYMTVLKVDHNEHQIVIP